jgi:hypothetical protein
MNLPPLAGLFALWLLTPAVFARHGTVRTLDGRTLSGDIQPGPGGGLLIQTSDNLSLPLALHDLAHATIPLITNVPTRIIHLRNGTAIGVDALEADESAVRFVMRHDKLRVSVIEVAAILFQPMDLATLPAGRRGVVLPNGDFLDGEFRGLADKRVRLSTVLLGPKQFEIGKACAAIVLNPPTPVPARWEIRTFHGSLFRAVLPPVVLGDAVRMTDLQLGDLRLPFADITGIVVRPGAGKPPVP